MSFLHTLTHFANAVSGIVLILIWWAIGSCSHYLKGIQKELECLHNDYNVVTKAHERDAWDTEQKSNIPFWARNLPIENEEPETVIADPENE